MNRHVTGTSGRTAFAVGGNLDERLGAACRAAAARSHHVGWLEGRWSYAAALDKRDEWLRSNSQELNRARDRAKHAEALVRQLLAQLGGRK